MSGQKTVSTVLPKYRPGAAPATAAPSCMRLALLAISLVWLTAGCDLLRLGSFTVAGWLPGPGFHPRAESLCLSLTFSQPPDRAAVESAFSLSEDGHKVDGRFAWSGSSLSFHPTMGFRANADYLLTLSSLACDYRGLNLDRDFQALFTTRASQEAPVVLDFRPPSGDTALELEFSKPVYQPSLLAAVSISPPLFGSWIFPAPTIARFTPAAAWRIDCDYRLSLSTQLRDTDGKHLAQAFTQDFDVRPVLPAPVVLSIQAMDPAGTILHSWPVCFDPQSEDPVIEGWEADWRLVLVFDQVVRLDSLDGRLDLAGGPALVRQSGPELDCQAVFSLASRPAWGSLAELRLSQAWQAATGLVASLAYKRSIRFDGPGSEPPRLLGLRLARRPLAAEPADQDLVVLSQEDAFGYLLLDGADPLAYPYQQPVYAWLELYFRAVDAIDPFSLMTAFRVDASNGCLSFSPLSVDPDAHYWPDPYQAWADTQRVSLYGRWVNSIEAGMLSFLLAPGVTDRSGNRQDEAWRLVMVK